MKSGLWKEKKFICILTPAAAAIFLICFLDRDPAVRWVNSYNTTMLAFSYQYGLIPRALIGTIYQGLADLLSPIGINLISMGAVKGMTLFVALLFVLLTLRFAAKCDGAAAEGMMGRRYLIAYFVITTVATFAGYYNFGRVDMYLVAATMLMVLLLTEGKCEWLICLLCPACVLIHEAYVFLYFNVVLVLLLYRLVRACEAADRTALKKYAIIAAVTFLLTCAVFLYMMLVGNKIGGQETYDAIYETAKAMVYKGKPHKDLIRAEILGVDLGSEEWDYHIANFWELGIFAILYSPFLIWLIAMIRRAWQEADENAEESGGSRNLLAKLPYLALALGALTTLPLFVLKIDYGRWVYAAIAYYCMTILAFMQMEDAAVTAAVEKLTAALQKRGRFLPALLLLYSVAFVPFYDMSIDRVVQAIYDAFIG